MAKKAPTPRGLCGCIFVLFIAGAIVHGFYLGITRPLEKVGVDSSAQVTSISGSGSSRHIRYRFHCDKGYEESSDTAWSSEASGVSKGSSVPIFYDPEHPSRSRLGSKEEPWGEYRLKSLFNEAMFVLFWGVLGLIAAALKGKKSGRK